MKHYYSGFGISIGTAIGGGTALILYTTTQNPIFIAFTGVGTALGLIYGAALDSKEKDQQDKKD